MRIVKVKGGLGNQLFQYTFARLLEQLTGDKVKLDMQAYKSLLHDPIRRPRLLKFNIALLTADEDEIADKCLLKHSDKVFSYKYKFQIATEALFNHKYFFEKNRDYIKPASVLNYDYYDGYWQSWRYVDAVWEIVKKDLVPNYDIDITTKKMIEHVKGENSVFLGVRKGDYSSSVSHYGTFGNKYYQKAMNYVCEKIRNPVFYVFSNDIPWVKANINFSGRNVIYREPEGIVDDFEDLLIMAACKHSIIINSTYHWWGARLYDSPNKIVVAPEKWFFDNKPIDIVPPHWVRLEE